MQAIQGLTELLQASVSMPYIGEEVSQLEHALQCADLAANAGADDELVLATLLHDIGHICASPETPRMGDFGIEDHEGVGARYLARLGFSKTVCDLVKGHVNAKRYLAFKNAAYAAKLSPASIETLRFQGGPMSAEEAGNFEKDPLFRKYLQLRAWDELGKVVGKKVPDLSAYAGMIARNLS